MGTQQATERSPLLHDGARATANNSSARVRDAAQAFAVRVRRGIERHQRALMILLAVAAAAIALLMAYVVFYDGSTPLAPLPGNGDTYDAIVIGGGPAGAVIAKLLADDPWRKVLLIEAGGASQVELGGETVIASSLNTQRLTPFDVPFYWTNVANTPHLHWDYPDVNVAKALGGCGIHNAMLYVRALPRDLERWAMANWTWAKALEIYLQMEDFDGPNSTYHSSKGFVRTTGASARDALSDHFVQACERIGLPRTEDFNAPGGRVGAGFYHFNTRDGSQRPNFCILLNTLVSRVVIDDAAEAQGVDVVHASGARETIRLTANGEVIVTAGAINTPKVLMQSGIGDAATLKRLAIPVKKHLARVGMNLQDHPVLGVTFESLAPVAFDLASELALYFRARNAHATNASSYGVLGSAGISAGAFLIPPGSTTPELQLTFFPRKSEPHLSNSSELNHTAQILFTVALLTPRARNRVVLTPPSNSSSNSSSSVDPEQLIPRVVSEVPGDEQEEHLRGDDVWKLSYGVRVVREIAASMAERGLVGKELSPGADVVETEALNKWVLGAVFRNSHWVGSASMASFEAQGVVDSRLRVFGVKRLRVADASVIPSIPNGNVHSSVLMVASHAAEIIRADTARQRA